MFEGIQVDLQDVTLLEQASRDNLINFANSGIGHIDYENYLAEVISANELLLCVTLEYVFPPCNQKTALTIISGTKLSYQDSNCYHSRPGYLS